MYTFEELFDAKHWYAFHDAVVEAQRLQNPLPVESLKQIFADLPERIQEIAFVWGLSDTVFRDEVFVYLRSKIRPPA